MKKTLLLLLLSFAVSCGQKQEEAAPAPVAFEELSFEEQHAQLTGELETAKVALGEKEQYACCVQPACNFCLIHDKHCGCALHVTNNEPVCGECGQLWAMGKGRIPNVKPEDVKWGPESLHVH